MSIPITNNIIQQQPNLVINQGQLQHAIMTTVNANNGIPITVATNAPITLDQQHQAQTGAQVVHQVQMQQPQPMQPVIQQQIQVQPMETQAAVSMPTMQVQQVSMPQTASQPPPIQPAVANSPIKAMHTSSSGLQSAPEATQMISKSRMADLVRDIDPNLSMEDDVEEILLSYVDEFVDRVLNGASMIARHRKVNVIEVKDVQQYLNRNYSMWVPGLGTDELRPYKRSSTTEAHKQRIALIRKALKK